MPNAYSYLLNTHIIAISLSGLIYFSRLISSICGAQWAYNKVVKSISYLVDTILLVAAISLWLILPKEFFENGWLYTKILVVLIYIIAGFVAMKRNVDRPIRVIFGIISILCYGMILGIAINHSPLGWFD